MVMESHFDPMLIALSVLVAIFASFVALNLVHSVRRATGWAYGCWLTAGAIAMGTGIWSMHFIGMLAFEMPGMTMAYDVPLMLLSVLVAIAASWLALFMVSRDRTNRTSLGASGVAMAMAISGMHYIGMYSMRMSARIEWNSWLVALSIAIALGASLAALQLLIRLREKTDRYFQLLAASSIMGFAISGMHYTGMLAATFVHVDSLGITSDNLVVSDGLTLAVFNTTISILALALASSLGQRIWERRAKGEALKLGRSEEKFRLLVDAVKDYAIFMLDTEGRVSTWNAGAKRLNGYSDDEIIGKHVSVFYIRQDVENGTAEHELNIARRHGHFEGEGLRVRKDGSSYWANLVITPLLNADGQVSGYSKVVRDITEVKENNLRLRKMNEELEERVRLRTFEIELREHQLRTVTNAVPILIAQAGADEKIQFANEAFCRWFDRTGETIIGCSMRELLGEDRYPENHAYIRRALNGEAVTYERFSRGGGREAVLNITFVPEMASTGKISGMVIVASDITKQKEIQTELAKAKDAAEVANSAKSAFLANMSHEIRTPLGAILGFSELLINEKLSAGERADSVEVIKRNGRLLSNVINDILDISKVEAGKMEIEKMNVSFDEIMKDMSSILSLEADKKGIALNVISEGMIPNMIKTDPLRLRQILLNIVGNAIKFTAKGSVEMRIRLVHPAGERAQLAFVVKDTGEGIHPEHVQRLFMPFQQADVSITRKFGGTGLGLVLSRKLAAALGGDVKLIETRPGAGSTFMVTIDPEVSGEIQQNYSARSSLSAPNVPAPALKLDGMKILVVDDSPDNQALISAILRHAGALTEAAGHGGEAVNLALTGDFDVVLMDLQMPVMDGYEATRVLRERGYRKPIVALTAHAMKEERDRTLASGFDNHVTKPIDQRALIRTIAGYEIGSVR